jgi:cell division GTPase FtsZ
MKRREFLKGISSGILSVTVAPELLAQLYVRNHTAMPVPVSTIKPSPFPDLDENARIRAVGVGALGASMVQVLSRNLPGILCHEVIFNPGGESSEKLTTLFSDVKESDLLFVLTCFDDEYCEAVARAIGCSAREAGVLTLAITPDSDNLSSQSLAELAEDVDIVFPVSFGSFTADQVPFLIQRDALTGYSMRHLVSAITTLIHQRSLICVDFADIVTIMRGGNRGWLGAGVASGPAKGRIAAMLALERLAAQGMATFDTTGVLAIVQGSSLFTMEDFDEASGVIHYHVAEDSNLMVGFITDDQLGFNVRVSIMPVQ